MKQAANRFTFRSFSSSALETVVRSAAGMASKMRLPDQVRYLSSYLKNIGAKTIVREAHYIDRHFIEEYEHYYSRLLRPRPNSCQRLHFFSRQLGAKAFECSAKNFEETQSKLSESYLGFVVIRPVPSVPVGRTVLRPYTDDARRAFPVVRPYKTHVAGFELSVEGLAFSQQDDAVGRCATTAIWTALQRSTHADGARAPTPYRVTEAALRVLSGSTRPVPSPGLSVTQMVGALTALGYPPVGFSPDEDPQLFAVFLASYLQSGMPAILCVHRLDESGDEGHAMTVVGFRPSTTALRKPLHKGGALYFGALENGRLYVHDDRLGPYARLGLQTYRHKDSSGMERSKIKALLEWPPSGKPVPPEELSVDFALVPLYSKLRSSIAELFQAAVALHGLFEVIAPEANGEPLVSLSFKKAGDFLRQVQRSDLSSKDKWQICSRAALSRYVGIITVFAGSGGMTTSREPAVDLVFDMTDKLRDDGLTTEHLLMCVPRNPKWREFSIPDL